MTLEGCSGGTSYSTDEVPETLESASRAVVEVRNVGRNGVWAGLSQEMVSHQRR